MICNCYSARRNLALKKKKKELLPHRPRTANTGAVPRNVPAERPTRGWPESSSAFLLGMGEKRSSPRVRTYPAGVRPSALPMASGRPRKAPPAFPHWAHCYLSRLALRPPAREHADSNMRPRAVGNVNCTVQFPTRVTQSRALSSGPSAQLK